MWCKIQVAIKWEGFIENRFLNSIFLLTILVDITSDYTLNSNYDFQFAYFFVLFNCAGIFNDEALAAYKSLDAYNYVHCGWVSELRIHETDHGYVFVATQVRPSQHTTILPYDVWALVHKEDGCVKGARCRCMAGLGEACSHVGALLFMMVGATDLGLNKPNTCTDVASKWAFKAGVVPARLADIDFSRPQYGKEKLCSGRCLNMSFTSSSSGGCGALGRYCRGCTKCCSVDGDRSSHKVH